MRGFLWKVTRYLVVFGFGRPPKNKEANYRKGQNKKTVRATKTSGRNDFIFANQPEDRKKKKDIIPSRTAVPFWGQTT